MAQGTDLSEKLGYRLMQGRLGVYGQYVSHENVDTNLSGVQIQNTHLGHLGGNRQHDRMIMDKRRTLMRLLHYSYQAADVKKIRGTQLEESDVVRALINPNKVKMDYDDKHISILHDHNYQPGDVFEWVGTGTYWLIYLQDLTELAYFRGDIRRCSHMISWEDEEGPHTTYAAIQGPVETKIEYIQKHGVSADLPNSSLRVYIPKSDAALKYFTRYNKFYLSNDPKKVCWRIEASDWLSMPGVIELSAIEYYRNEDEDDVEQGVVGALIAEPVSPNARSVNRTIEGESFIKPKKTYEYKFKGNIDGEWSVEKDIPVLLEPDGKIVKLKWLDTFTGQFELCYGGVYKKTIVVESLF